MTKRYSNPVLEIYKGKRIRRWQDIYLKVTGEQLKELIDIAEATGLSLKKILAYSGQPCERCRGMDVVVFTDSGTHMIKRGILKVPHQASGCNITHTNNAKSDTTDTAIKQIV